ncbi:MAG: isoprenyl transferase [Clostridiales bacterium]
MYLSKIFNRNKNILNKINEFENLPNHVGIIMDGNGRWAKKRNLPRSLGHRAGSKNLKKVVRIFKDYGVKFLTVYAFSTENWTRPKKEVDGLMELLLEYLKNAEEELGSDNVRIRVIGNISKLSDELQYEIKRVEKITKSNDGIDLIIAINYGSKFEILNSVNKIIKDIDNGSLDKDKITEKDISDRLYTVNIPDPDLLIRTSGELRISNFLLWQGAYSEMWFTDVYWPDFNKKEIDEALSQYNNRKRRFGGV